MMTADELKTLLHSDRDPNRERATAYLFGLLTSPDKGTRARGYELFQEGLNETLYRSCLNHSSPVGGFTHPLVNLWMRSIEAWAEPTN